MSTTLDRIYAAFWADQRQTFDEETRRQILPKYLALSLWDRAWLTMLSDSDLFTVCCGEQLDDLTAVREDGSRIQVPKEVSDFLTLVFEWSTD
jgi:hypothetical protein